MTTKHNKQKDKQHSGHPGGGVGMGVVSSSSPSHKIFQLRSMVAHSVRSINLFWFDVYKLLKWPEGNEEFQENLLQAS